MPSIRTFRRIYIGINIKYAISKNLLKMILLKKKNGKKEEKKQQKNGKKEKNQK